VTTTRWEGTRVCVAGLGVSGAAAARALLDRGALVVAVDARDDERVQPIAEELRARGAQVRLGDAETPVLADLVVTSPGWRPTQPLLAAAHDAGVEVIGEPELAWRLQLAERERRQRWGPVWLGVTGTNGKTTTVGMLAAILQAAGYRAAAVGNMGVPLVEAALAEPAYDVLAVEMSSFQLHWSSTIEFQAAAILNLAEDHLDWHGSFEAYAADKVRIWGDAATNVGRPYVLFNADDSTCARLAEPYVDQQCFTLGPPRFACFCIDDGVLVDRMSGLGEEDAADATVASWFWSHRGIPLARVEDVHLPGPHNLANALAAAGLARQLNLDPTYPVPPGAVAAGLSAYRPGAHRNALVAMIDDVAYVDDSKATNPHAAAASLAAYDHVVWIAGGLLKGAAVDDLVAEHRSRMRGAVLVGADRQQIRDALARHAPDVPVVEVTATDTGAMNAVVAAAAEFAAPGDTVVLAPAAASMDMFRDYAERGDAFAAAVRRQAEGCG
jgi:UDP-N-acetylmuramoylalanine--D-glutamate ligase